MLTIIYSNLSNIILKSNNLNLLITLLHVLTRVNNTLLFIGSDNDLSTCFSSHGNPFLPGGPGFPTLPGGPVDPGSPWRPGSPIQPLRPMSPRGPRGPVTKRIMLYCTWKSKKSHTSQ